MVLYLAAFVATMPKVFEGMLKIRIGYVSFLKKDVPIKTKLFVTDVVLRDLFSNLNISNRTYPSLFSLL